MLKYKVNSLDGLMDVTEERIIKMQKNIQILLKGKKLQTFPFLNNYSLYGHKTILVDLMVNLLTIQPH